MNTTLVMDSGDDHLQNKPGMQLAAIRLQKGYSTEYVAGKLHLRVRIIELLEADDYDHLPEAVFIRGYIRAYAKLLEISSEAMIEVYNQLHVNERPRERALWQSRRQTNKAEHAVRWVTVFFGLAVLIAVAMWWDKNKDNDALVAGAVTEAALAPDTVQTEIRLTDLSKMRSLLSSANQSSILETASE
ncbi:MAG: helix-turn-helix domain-containing protein [Legionellaceae bacterium]